MSVFNVVLAAYSEILLKSSPVRKLLEDMLIHNVCTTLRMNNLGFKDVSKEGGRIYVHGADTVRVCRAVSNVFGVEFSAPAVKTSASLQAVVEAALDVADEALKDNQSFAVEARRVGKHPYSSQDLKVKVGAAILNRFGGERNLHVNLKHPERRLYIEVRNTNAYVYSGLVEGWGGLPVGSQGKAVSIISSHTHTALSTWLMMRRGVIPVLLHVTFGGVAEAEKALPLIRALKPYFPRPSFRVHITSFSGITEALSKVQNTGLQSVLTQQATVIIACRLARLKGAYGVVTGMLLEPSPTQALRLLEYLSQVSDIPLLHPLMGMSAAEIEEFASKLKFPCTGEIEKHLLGVHEDADYFKVDGGKLSKWEKKLNIEKLIDSAFDNLQTVDV